MIRISEHSTHSAPLLKKLTSGRRWLQLLLVCAAPSAFAQTSPPELVFPLDCKDNSDCVAVYYPDRLPGPGVRDYQCGNNALDGLPYAQISIRSLYELDKGIAVRAAADGEVKGGVDGIHDEGPNWRDREGNPPPYCGNGIEIDHGNGWTGRYCHLREGSLFVKQGDRVKAGDTIAFAGWSGKANLPGLGFWLRRSDNIIDPFDSEDVASPCEGNGTPLWKDAPRHVRRYEELIVVDAGFTASPQPLMPDVIRGYHHRRELPLTSPTLVFWVLVANVTAGEVRTMQIVGPDNKLVAEQKHEERDNRPVAMLHTGAARPEGGWKAGEYTATLVIAREVNERVVRVNKIYRIEMK
jgi:hypothetical protein